MPNPFSKQPAPKGTPLTPAQAKAALNKTQQSKPSTTMAGAGKSPEAREIAQTGRISGKNPNVFKPNTPPKK